MISVFHNALGVMRYERRMLIRTVKFWIWSGLAMGIFILNGIRIALFPGLSPGTEAYAQLLTYTLFYCLVIPFLVGSFRAADQRARIDEVVAGRPISTAELVVGKYLGGVSALFFLSLGGLILALGIQAATISMTGDSFAIEPYLLYLVFLNLPALIFLSSLTFFLGVLLRQPIAAALIATAYSLSIILFFGERYGGIYDFGAFYLRMHYSDLMGLGEMTQVGLQRVLYIFLGLGLLGLAIDRYPRLAHSATARWGGRGGAVTCFGLAAGLYAFMEVEARDGQAYRQSLLARQEAVAHIPPAAITHYDLSVTLLGKYPLAASGTITLQNPHEVPLDTLILSLNPGVKIQSLTRGDGGAMTWTRRGSVIRVIPGDPLLSERELDLTLSYAGEIDTDGFDLEREKGKPRLRTGGNMDRGSLTAWIRDRSILLPPRSRWYPVAGVDYGDGHARPVSFATANLHIAFPKGLEVITQGQVRKADTLDTRVMQAWVVEKPVPVLSLNAGVYRVYRATIHGIACALYVHPSHLNAIHFFESTEGEIGRALEQIVDLMEREAGMKYPYPTLAVVEVPFHIQWYYEGWEERGGLTQPGVLMIEEDVLIMRLRNSDRDKKVQKDLLVRAILETFFGEENAERNLDDGLFRSPVFQLWAYDKHFVGDHDALLKKGLPMYLQDELRTEMTAAFYPSQRQSGDGAAAFVSRRELRAWNKLIAQMQDRSFADLDPEQDAALYRQVLEVKGPALFEMMASFLGKDAFRTVLSDIDQSYEYKALDFATFQRVALSHLSDREDRLRLQRLIGDWIYGTEIPGYTLTKVDAMKMDDGSGTLAHQLVVRIKNGEPGRGYVQITAVGRDDEIAKGVEIKGGQEIEVSMVLWERPLRVVVDPFLARNREPLASPVRAPEQVTKGRAVAYLKDVTGEDEARGEGALEIVIDNDDRGFSMPIRRATRFSRPGIKGGNWREHGLAEAYGRYEKTYRQKRAGDGAQPAVWTARIPKAGAFDVGFYFPDPARAKREGIGARFTLTVFCGGKADTLAMERDRMKAGWNHLGRYKFAEGEAAVVELSDLAEGRLYADAVRWRFVDRHAPR